MLERGGGALDDSTRGGGGVGGSEDDVGRDEVERVGKGSSCAKWEISSRILFQNRAGPVDVPARRRKTVGPRFLEYSVGVD